MNLDWAATLPDTGRYTGAYVTTDESEFAARVSELRARGVGYLELNLEGQDYPALMIGFHFERAVVHLRSAEDEMSLLVGDGSVPASEDVTVPIMDEEGWYLGETVVATERAFELVNQFIRTGDAESLGDWEEV